MRGEKRPVGRPRKDPTQDLSKLATHSSQALPGLPLHSNMISIKQEQVQGSILHPAASGSGTSLAGFVSSQGLTYSVVGDPNVRVPISTLGGTQGGVALLGQTSSPAHSHQNAAIVVGNPSSNSTIPSLLGGGGGEKSVEASSSIVSIVNSDATATTASGVASGTFVPPCPPPLKSINDGVPSSSVVPTSILPATTTVAVSGRGGGVSGHAHEGISGATGRVYKKRGPKRKSLMAGETESAMAASTASFQLQGSTLIPDPPNKRRRGRPRGSGAHSERGRSRRGGRLPSYSRLASILPRPLTSSDPPVPPVIPRDNSGTAASSASTSSWEVSSGQVESAAPSGSGSGPDWPRCTTWGVKR